MGTRARNRLHSLLHRFNLKPPAGKIFAQKHRDWWLGLDLSPTQRMHIRHDLATIDHIEQQLEEIKEELSRLSTAEPWADQVPYLLQLPGFGLIVTLTVLAAIGDITRFSHPKRLVGYAGLGASIHDSGMKHRTGRITKRGRKELRWILVACPGPTGLGSRLARSRHSPLLESPVRAFGAAHWIQQSRSRSRPSQDPVGPRGKLLVAAWYVLTERSADRHADPDKVAFKYIMWSWKLDDVKRSGMSTRQPCARMVWTRYHLMRLQLGNDLTHILRGGHRYSIAPAEELQALLP
ncbi:MAG: transposase [Anaerolineales bacterium]